MSQFENKAMIFDKTFSVLLSRISLFSLMCVLLLASIDSFGQSLNDYKYLVMKKQYGFQDSMNEYRLNSNARFMLKEQGFEVLFDDEILPDDLAKDRCKAMYLEIAPKDALLSVKLGVVFKDCYNKVLFACTDGVSKEKSKQTAYNEALIVALNSVKPLKYKFNGVNIEATSTTTVALPVSENVLSAKSITNGFQLIDNQGNIAMTILKTSNKDCFLATKNSIQGIFISKEYQWFFEYYKDNQFYSEKVKVSF